MRDTTVAITIVNVLMDLILGQMIADLNFAFETVAGSTNHRRGSGHVHTAGSIHEVSCGNALSRPIRIFVASLA